MDSFEEGSEILVLMKGRSLNQPSHWHFLCALPHGISITFITLIDCQTDPTRILQLPVDVNKIHQLFQLNAMKDLSF